MKSTVSMAKPILPSEPAGFTLIEVLIALAVSAIVVSAMLLSYQHMQDSSSDQVQMSTVQENLRGVFGIMERDLRMAGLNDNQSPSFGVTDVQCFEVKADPSSAIPAACADGVLAHSPILRMTMDLNNNDTVDAGETISYFLYDKDGDGVYDLARSTTDPGAGQLPALSNLQLMADNIDAIGFAYAFDNNGDDAIDRDAGGNIIWGVDTTNDGNLDKQLNADGSTTALGYTVPPAEIEAVQVWVLARASRTSRGYVNTHTYQVGDRTIGPMNDGYKRWLLTEVLDCRNL